ncbi:dimethylarginine dimethylaminohydrolase family protein [Pelagibius sp. Alg239-R121]|uniref:dimethylarginine dimethylaminohydrolase family protein n=1 Tax=Pelagibius sp. Alg239-R121 TaxID=2993448 RepID=UPI0024A7469A|nr:arginine deiminase-related protein [Pelagibius sp. Alg239-R121]
MTRNPASTSDSGFFGTSAYGGEGWSQRLQDHQDELGSIWSPYRLDSEWQTLKAVLLHCPGSELDASVDPDAVQMLAPLDRIRAAAQHDALAEAYRQNGVEVHYVDPSETAKPNQMFCADLFFMTAEGAILARPASTVRAGEERWIARRLADLGVPLLRSLTGKATFEGADAMWLDPMTVILGRGPRTNAEGVRQIGDALADIGVEAIVVDMPYGTMHLMGMLRFPDRGLAVAWPRRTPHAAVEALQEREYRIIWLPDENVGYLYRSLNFVTLGPGRILMPEGHEVVQRLYEANGIDCTTLPMDELAKAAGAVGCLTGVLCRERG